MSRQAASDARARRGWEEPSEELDRCARAVIGAAIEVHRHLGPGFLEAIYEEAMTVELRLRRLFVERQVPIALRYKGHPLPQAQLDLVVEGQLVVELKAVERVAPVHVAQLISYLRAGAFQLGLLINFNAPTIQQGVRRVIWSG